MKRVFLEILVMAALLTLTACGTTPNSGAASADKSNALPPAQQEESGMVPDTSDAMEDTALEGPFSETAITITVSDQTFSATLLDNETARQLAEQLPLTLNMSELNGNEKYFYMDMELPTDSYQPVQINAGDLMLYGNNCLVLFYESFSSGYSYTQLGRVDNPTGLAEALGAGSVEVAFYVEDSE